ncbi:MAG: hypothetical protein IPO99_18020 [Nitrospira sp.]|nr:hypothetical protein [Nitrospira sp.]
MTTHELEQLLLQQPVSLLHRLAWTDQPAFSFRQTQADRSVAPGLR